MNKEWSLPSVYISNTAKNYDIAVGLINSYVENSIDFHPQLIEHIENFFCDPKDAETALRDFATQLDSADAAADIFDDAESLAVISVAIVRVWSSRQHKDSFEALRALIRNSWWLEHLWVDATIALARRNESFRSAIVELAVQHFIDVEEQLNKEDIEYLTNLFTLNGIWNGHPYENRVNESSWSWVRLLAELETEQFLKSIALIRNPILLYRVLGSPEFYNNYDLWELSIQSAPLSFEEDGSWNGEILLPSLLRFGKSMLFHVADKQEHSKDILEEHIRNLLARLSETISKRADFTGIFKRWGAWIARQHLNFPANESQRKTLIDNHDLLMALAKKISHSFSPSVSSNLDNSWDPWAYQSMLALLHSDMSAQFSPPDITSFIGEWNQNPDEWDSEKGQRIREHVKHYNSSQPNRYACKVLGYSVALTDDFANNWLSMWNGSVALRDILEFLPTITSKHWRSSDISGLMKVLVDIGLGILDCTAYEQDPLDSNALSKSAELFDFLWSATTEMLNIDLYGEEFWTYMQQHLAIRRIGWTIESNLAAESQYSLYLDKKTHPKAEDLLKSMSTNTSSILKLLPLLVPNTITKDNLRSLLIKSKIDMTALAVSARKYQQAPKIKFNIQQHHVDLVEELK